MDHRLQLIPDYQGNFLDRLQIASKLRHLAATLWPNPIPETFRNAADYYKAAERGLKKSAEIQNAVVYKVGKGYGDIAFVYQMVSKTTDIVYGKPIGVISYQAFMKRREAAPAGMGIPKTCNVSELSILWFRGIEEQNPVFDSEGYWINGGEILSRQKGGILL